MPKDDAGEVHKPNLEAMAKLFGSLRKLNEDGAKIRGDMSADWKVIEQDYHCNKRAAKQLLKLKYESSESRDDYLRTLMPGLVVLGILPEEDLIDLMGGDDAPGVKRTAKAMGLENLAASQGAAVQ